MRRQVGALMTSSVVALGVSVINSTAKAEDDASQFTYTRLHCTPDNQSHFTGVTIEFPTPRSLMLLSPVGQRRGCQTVTSPANDASIAPAPPAGTHHV